jgi:hypothetical protein
MWYFGVWPGRGDGHFLHDHTGRILVGRNVPPLPVRHDVIDGGLLPPDAIPGTVYEVQAGLYRFFSFFDRTGDSRPGSVSVFIGTGDGGSGWYMQEAERIFPEVFARLRHFGITLEMHDPDAEE